MTETPGGPPCRPQKADKNKRNLRVLGRITELSSGFVPGPISTRSFVAVTGQYFQTFPSGPPMALLWCLAPVTHRWLAVDGLYYLCIRVTAYCWVRGNVFINSPPLLSLTKSAMRGLSKHETLNCRQLKSIKHPTFRGIALLHVCRESATRGSHQLLSINRSITHTRLGNNN